METDTVSGRPDERPDRGSGGIFDEREIMVVSSGAIATTVWKFGLKSVPKDANEQAQLAGEGQPVLMREYQQRFEAYGKRSAQCLLCRDDIDMRKRRRNLRTNQDGYFRDGIIAVYNENDFLSTDEIIMPLCNP